MKEYNFQSVNQRKALILFVTMFALFFALIFGMTSLKNVFNIYVTMIFSFGIPISIFLLNKKRIKENCNAKISEKNTEIEKEGKIHIINFEEIRSYKIETYNNSTSLNIKLKNNEKFCLNTNSNFGDTKNFENYCSDLETAIESYKKTHLIEIERVKTFFEKTWIFPFLVIITLIIIVFVIIIISKGKGFPTSLISALAPLLILWSGYFNAKNKKNN